MINDIKCFVSGMCETNSFIISDENKNCVIVGSGRELILFSPVFQNPHKWNIDELIRIAYKKNSGDNCVDNS